MFGREGGMVSGGLFMWVFWFILLALIVVIIRAVLIGITPDKDNKQLQKDTPLDILKIRYASGEIDEEEFERRRRELER
jgi:putative membrane protein